MDATLPSTTETTRGAVSRFYLTRSFLPVQRVPQPELRRSLADKIADTRRHITGKGFSDDASKYLAFALQAARDGRCTPYDGYQVWLAAAEHTSHRQLSTYLLAAYDDLFARNGELCISCSSGCWLRR